MIKSMGKKFYVVYACPQVEFECGEIRNVCHIPVSNNYHSDIQSAKKEYDELSASVGKLLGLVEAVDFMGASV
ncbi:MAG: hypothetical protein P4L87_01970 [Formivibrio sp.]|nr:hypothetical protein [Formivibrio sp.]